jgi:hypothetical protein
MNPSWFGENLNFKVCGYGRELHSKLFILAMERGTLGSLNQLMGVTLAHFVSHHAAWMDCEPASAIQLGAANSWVVSLVFHCRLRHKAKKLGCHFLC